MRSFAIFCQEGPRKVYIRCLHNSRHRTLFLNSGLNTFCLCHVGENCNLELGTDTRAREVLVEIKEGNLGRQVFLLYEGNKDQSYTEVGSLQNMAITAIFKNKGESLLKTNVSCLPALPKKLEKVPSVRSHIAYFPLLPCARAAVSLKETYAIWKHLNLTLGFSLIHCQDSRWVHKCFQLFHVCKAT
jgi:hypothetical protein